MSELLGRPTVAEVLPVVRAYQAVDGNGCGGHYHVVLDEGNVKTEDVEGCLARAADRGDALGVELGRLLMQMTRTQRGKLARLFYLWGE